MSSVDQLNHDGYELRRRLTQAQEKVRLYESSLQEIANALSVKHVLLDLQLSQTAVEGLRQSLEALRSDDSSTTMQTGETHG